MSWWLIIALAAGAYAFKVVGVVVIGSRPLPCTVERCLALIPAALISALVVTGTLSIGQELVVDARAAGVGAAAVAAWRRAPLIAVVAVGATVTAILRLLS